MQIKLILLLTLLVNVELSAQKTLPPIMLEDLNGNSFDLNSGSDSRPHIVSFWATWCEPCLKELDALNKNRSYIVNELNAIVVPVSVDDSRTISRIKPLVAGNSWNFKVYLDLNQEAKRSLSIIDIPHTLIVYKNKVIYEHTGYLQGDEKTIFAKIIELN